MRFLVGLILSLALGVVGGVFVFNSGVFHKQIEQQVNQQAGFPIRLGKMKIALAWPPRLQIGATQIKHSSADVDFERLTVMLNGIFPPYAIGVETLRPRVVLKMDGSTTASAPAPQAGSGPTVAPKTPIGELRLKIQDGEIRVPQGSVSHLNLQFEQKALLRSVAKINVGGKLHTAFVPGSLPFSVASDDLTLSLEAVKAGQVHATLAGLRAEVQGGSLLNEARHRWLIEVKVPDLSQVPQPAMDIPAKDWRGTVDLKMELTKESAQKPWQAEGRGVLKNLSAQLNWVQNDMSVQGPFKLDLESHFLYLESGIAVPSVKGSLDLTQAKVFKKDLFEKIPDVPLHVVILGKGDQNQFEIQNLDVKLWRLQSKIVGRTEIKAPHNSRFQMEVMPTSLTGAEALLIPLRKSPVKGELAASIEGQGPLMDPLKMNIQVKALKLKDFSGYAEYASEAVQVKGPLQATVDGQGQWNAGEIKSVQANGAVELKGLAIASGPFRKEAGQELSAQFSMKSQGTSTVQLQPLAVKSFFGNVRANGSLTNPTQPQVNLRVDMQPLNLLQLRQAIAQFKDVIPVGTVNGAVTLKGGVDLKQEWPKWPLAVGGDLNVVLPQYKMASASPETTLPAKGAPTQSEKPVESFLPDGELTRKLALGLNVTINEFSKDELNLKELKVQGRLREGRYLGGVSIGEIFGGQVNLNGLDVPLLVTNPLIQGTASWDRLIIEDVMGFAKPEFKGFASGRTAGRTSFATLMPGSSEFMNRLKAKGDLSFQPVTLHSVQIGQIINDLIKKVPVIKMSPAKLDPLRGLVQANFDWSAGVMNINSLLARDVDNSEIHLQGKVVIGTMDGDLKGKFLWAKPQVKGCIMEGNADAQGRMEIPLAFKGKLNKPELSAAGDIATKLGENALKCEQKRMVKKLEQKGKEKAKEELNKVLKGILGN